MSDLKLFRITDGQAEELEGTAVALEKSLQTLIEANLESMLGIRLLASEHPTGPRHGGRIDTLGLDENGIPVIIEYKRARNENVVNQGLFYLDWLMDHRADFKLLVIDRLGREVADAIDWNSPRLLCIAGDFNRYDEHAVQQMNRNIELVKYRRFGNGLLLLEHVNASTAETSAPAHEEKEALAEEGSTTSKSRPTRYQYKHISQVLEETSGELSDLYEELKSTLIALADDVQVKVLKWYVAFKRLKNFACVEMHPNKGCLYVYVKVDPDESTLEKGFTRDVRNVGHYGTGDLEITLRNSEDLQRAYPLLVRSYEAS